MAKKTALVLSGGGAKGAFEVGAEKYAREVKGYTWDVIAGVSVGALNGAMLAMHKYDRLFEIWNTVANDKVYTGGFGVWSALKIGAFALSENNLYTVEAFAGYLERLDEGGMLSMTRWHQTPPDQLLRLVSLGREALAARGARDAARHFVIVRGPEEGMPLTTANVLLKRSPFTDEEVERAEAFARRLQLEILYTPRTRPPGDLTRLVTAPDPAAGWRTYPSDISPTTDDSPFFFKTVRPGNLFSKRWTRGEWRRTNLGTLVLFGLVGSTAFVVAAFILGPLLLARGRLGPAGRVSRQQYKERRIHEY